MASNSTFFAELTAAGRGVFALVTGNRRAADYFDFSDRGLVGSFIAFLTATLANAVLPALLAREEASGTVLQSLVMMAILFVFQVGFSAIVLLQLKRFDGFVPYLIADNWASFYVGLGSSALFLFGVASDPIVIAVGVLMIVVAINIGRLIVTLQPLQIAMFMIAQLVGLSIGLIIVGFMFPMPDVPLVSTPPA